MFLEVVNGILANYTYIIFAINILLLIILCCIIFSVKKVKNRWDKLNDYLGNVTKAVDSVRYGNLTKKIEAADIPENSENLTESLNRLIETLHDREKMVMEYQSELSKQNRRLEEIINSLSDGLIIIDTDKCILRATRNVAKWFNVDDGSKLLGNSLLNYIQIPKIKPIELLCNDEIIIPTDKGSNFEASTVKLRYEDEKTTYNIVIIKNVTSQKELETLKEDFVATLTHDLKVPIIAESNMIDLFLNGSFGEISTKQKLALNNMRTSGKELLELVQTVLDTYKFKDGKISLYKENILLKSFINEIIEEMQPIAQKTKNELVFNIERDIRVFADRFQLKRIVKNLIQNAISYGTPKSAIKISIGEIPNYVIIKIKDRGAGISKDDIEKIFNRYYSAAKKFKKIGTGLGLYHALQLVRAHNGDLTVESIKGEYTEFCIKIPAIDYERRFM